MQQRHVTENLVEDGCRPTAVCNIGAALMLRGTDEIGLGRTVLVQDLSAKAESAVARASASATQGHRRARSRLRQLKVGTSPREFCHDILSTSSMFTVARPAWSSD